MTDQELKDLVASLAIAQAETDKQLKETDRKLNKVAKLVGAIGNNQGDVAEEYFINLLEDKMELLGIKFDSLYSNLHKRQKDIEDEYDIVLVNGKNIVIIEVKYKVHENDVKKLDKKIKTFKELFLEYKNLKLYAGVAGFKVYKDAKEYAKEKGYFILQRKDDVVQTYAPSLRAA